MIFRLEGRVLMLRGRFFLVLVTVKLLLNRLWLERSFRWWPHSRRSHLFYRFLLLFSLWLPLWTIPFLTSHHRVLSSIPRHYDQLSRCFMYDIRRSAATGRRRRQTRITGVPLLIWHRNVSPETLAPLDGLLPGLFLFAGVALVDRSSGIPAPLRLIVEIL